MASLAVLCDVVGPYGGTERYWETVLPQLARYYDVRLFARTVQDADRFGVPAQQITWSDENSAPSVEAAQQVAQALSGCDAAITANVFDAQVLAAVRSAVPRWIARVHDYRPFCPNGNKLFPQFPAICTAAMGGACVANAIVRGCVQGPRVESFVRIAGRMKLRDRLKHADRLLVSSEYVRQTCVKNGIAEDRICITPPPLPDEAFVAQPRPPAGNAVLFSGRFNDQKGLRSLMRALARIPSAKRPRLIVAGAGDEREEIDGRAFAKQWGIEVSWRGWLSKAQLRLTIDEARIVAVPSLWPEPFGLVGTEAQARGRPVVAYDVGGVREWLADTGIAVPRGDEAALARAIERLSGDPATWELYAHAARERAERYRLDAHLQLLTNIMAVGAGEGVVR